MPCHRAPCLSPFVPAAEFPLLQYHHLVSFCGPLFYYLLLCASPYLTIRAYDGFCDKIARLGYAQNLAIDAKHLPFIFCRMKVCVDRVHLHIRGLFYAYMEDDAAGGLILPIMIPSRNTPQSASSAAMYDSCVLMAREFLPFLPAASCRYITGLT